MKPIILAILSAIALCGCKPKEKPITRAEFEGLRTQMLSTAQNHSNQVNSLLSIVRMIPKPEELMEARLIAERAHLFRAEIDFFREQVRKLEQVAWDFEKYANVQENLKRYGTPNEPKKQ